MYHEKAGVENTDLTLEMALRYAQEKGVRDIVVASTTGFTARRMAERCAEGMRNIVVVTHNTGFSGEGEQTFPVGLREELVKRGIKVLTGTMVLRSLGTAVRDSLSYSQQDLVANTLRMFSQGIKVCVEITAMAADAGLVPFEDVIAIGGTGRGADTACLIRANSSNRFFKIRIREIIIKPREF
jgi:uncharacterized protein